MKSEKYKIVQTKDHTLEQHELKFMTSFNISYNIYLKDRTADENNSFGEEGVAVKYLKEHRIEALKAGTVHEEALEVLSNIADKLKSDSEVRIEWEQFEDRDSAETG
jgi:hypothetical protein